ncbi:MAG: site-specific integrase [Candidatus Tectomicrobia bacterium]|uniref:Site-specific integrase n=1 Tax=Tectimicrobiota bacterium TaxID=2528274 RepID=A0A932I579_UNCTE|nr:site-specific integrase [Candidatus Tectomicrobia bacterium]
MDGLQKVETGEALALADAESSRRYAEASRAESTKRAYRADWRAFAAWAEARGLSPLPASPGAVCAFLAHEAERGRKVSTIERRLAAIALAHRAAGLESPTRDEAVRTTLKGIRREKGAAPRQKRAADADVIRELVRLCDTSTLRGLRDRALLLLGFAGAFRRSELAGLEAGDVEFREDGNLWVHLRRSKTDQEGQGRGVPIVRGRFFCPVGALRAWLAGAGIASGPVFRRLGKGGKVQAGALSGHSIGKAVKRYAERAGLRAEDFGGHSLRAGFVTAAAEAGKDVWAIMDVSRHRSVQTVRAYVRRADAFKGHAGEGLL